MNLLMISIDDLRPLINCYGYERMHTPNLDRLAQMGVRFDKNFCQVPVCGASRASLLTGMRPKRDRFIDFSCSAEQEAPGVSTLLHSFKEQGYNLYGSRKIFHQAKDYSDLWNNYYNAYPGQWPGPYYAPESQAILKEVAGKRRGPAFESADVSDESYVDGDAVQVAIDTLKQCAASGEKFVYGYGSINVHLPFKAPKKYWDLYDPADIELPPHDKQPDDVARGLFHQFGELRNYGNIPEKGPVDDNTARTLIHGYMAGVSFLDAQLGKLLDCLNDTGLSENTAILFWVDHGFNLGEHGLWCKHSLYETSLHIPLFMHFPQCADVKPGSVVNRVVENVDVFPTICEAFDLPKPDHLQGRSLMHLMRNPDTDWDAYAVSRYHAGETIRTDEYRYCEWLNETGIKERALFSHQDNDDETQCLANDPDHASVVETLSQRLSEFRSIA